METFWRRPYSRLQSLCFLDVFGWRRRKSNPRLTENFVLRLVARVGGRQTPAERTTIRGVPGTFQGGYPWLTMALRIMPRPKPKPNRKAANSILVRLDPNDAGLLDAIVDLHRARMRDAGAVGESGATHVIRDLIRREAKTLGLAASAPLATPSEPAPTRRASVLEAITATVVVVDTVRPDGAAPSPALGPPAEPPTPSTPDDGLRPHADKVASEWGLDEERARAWVVFAKKCLVPPYVPSAGFKASPEQMVSWLAEVLAKFAGLNGMTVLDVARENNEVVEPYIDAWFCDPRSGGYPKIEPTS